VDPYDGPKDPSTRAAAESFLRTIKANGYSTIKPFVDVVDETGVKMFHRFSTHMRLFQEEEDAGTLSFTYRWEAIPVSTDEMKLLKTLSVDERKKKKTVFIEDCDLSGRSLVDVLCKRARELRDEEITEPARKRQKLVL